MTTANDLLIDGLGRVRDTVHEVVEGLGEDELDAARMRRMSGNARRLAEAGHLGEGVTVESAADVMWTLSSPEVYDLLVRRRGWDPGGYRDFVARGIAALLAPPP